jgi:hypothetical protein
VASVSALESRSGSAAQYQTSWLEHRVRHVPYSIKPVTSLSFLPETQVNHFDREFEKTVSFLSRSSQQNADVSGSNEDVWQHELTSNAEA